MDITHPNNLKTSPAGLEFIKRKETLRLKVYPDIGGKPTIGFGHLLRPKEKNLKEITYEQAVKFLQEDTAVVEIFLNGTLRVVLNQNQFDALVSFVFNIGIGKFDTSTMLKRLQVGDFSRAAREFARWNKFFNDKTQKFEVSSGLTNRRADEAALFAKPV